MSDSASNHYWDSSGDVLQGIMGTRVTSTSSHLEPPSDGLATSPELPLGDPASFLGVQFSSDPDILPHDHASVLNPWPLHHNLPSSPTSHRFDYLQYRHARLGNNQDAWSPLQVTGMPVNPFHYGIRHLGETPQMGGLDRRYSTGQQSTPSENESQYTGIHPSDSGYGTRSCATRSVTTSSQAFEPAYSPSLAPHEPDPEDQLPDWDLNFQPSGELGYDAVEKIETPSLLCPDVIGCDYPGCPWTGKCPSDKRKHEARHRKLFKCDEPHCTRKEGFGTINDLSRHKKCVHKQDPERGPKMLFMCFGHNCPRKDKQWPRLDNFRQHLTRMHHDEDIDDLLKRSHDWYETCVKPREITSSIAEHLSEVKYALEANQGPMLKCTMGQTALDSIGIVQSEQVSRSFGNLMLDSTHDTFAAHKSDRGQISRQSISEASQSTDSAVPKTASMEPPATNRKPSISTSRGNTRHDRMEDMVTEAAVNMINAMTKIMDSNQRRRSQQADDASEMGDPHAGLSDRKREVLQKILSTALDHLSSHSDPASVHVTQVDDASKKGWIQCEFCSKRTRLRCEMKKHKKRHERPYGCTFHKCSKTFGSKADWKRHENSQHYHQQSWRCTLHDVTQGGLQCARLFYRQEVYTQHLKKHHHAGEDDVRAAIYKNCIGQNGQSHLNGPSQFWCGFCRDIVPLESQGLAAWNERFNHIDIEHFKQGERIGDWLLPSGHVTKDGARQEEKRKAVTDATEDDSEPVVDDNSDDSSGSDIYYSDSDGLHDEAMVISQEHGRGLSFQPFQDCLPDRSSTAAYPSMGSTNLRKRKLPNLQATPGFIHGRKDRSLSIEKRSRTQASSYNLDTTRGATE
ncbi:hypothetical protein P170DRAFT_439974 [Aspergillus steynii IBT 23096]|uniref:C2H2-type domain-containing protein n=1 Tax=Aspergillus steynii IBT 23096 TaxID=1392250 RepID=A0A2I2FVS8_9EURO|nr:uncharacterized protein P170DRAFT_439974 [Aspergillus steynii IBT 23096]PLB44724.1 hypothetical protein P170DRAFT_439974 [Aspergillus steynii IBT 23096]